MNFGEASTTILSDTKPKSARKISDFNEHMLERELAAGTPSVTQDRSPTPELINRPSNRQPFNQLQLKQAPHLPNMKRKEPKLDEFFKSILIVDKVD